MYRYHYHYHCHCITITVWLLLYHYPCITIPASLPVYHYQPVINPPQQAAVWGVWSLYHYQSVTHHDRLQYGEFGIQICITITVTVSLTHQSRLQFGEFGIQVCITVIVSLISLSPTTTGYSMGTREFGIQVCITITVMLLYQNYHYSPEQASVRGVWNSDLCQRLLFYHYQSVTYPPQQAIQNGEFGIQVCCITITVSRSVCDLPTTTSYSMGRLVFRSVSLSLNHYHCITIIVSLSLTHHNRLHHSNDCVWFQLQPLCHRLLAEALHTGVMWQRSWGVGMAQR